MRTAAALPFGLLLMLAGCSGADPGAPFTDSRIPGGLAERFYPPEGWAWGLLQVGKSPPVRYGVSAPVGVPKGQVLILTGHEQPAETWFETARDLNARGLTVWVLEPSGAGGSGRMKGAPRDLAHVTGFAPDVAAAQVMAGQIIRRGPLVVVASGDAAPVGISAAAGGVQARALILESPSMRVGGDPSLATWLHRLGLGGLRAEGGRWKREAPDDAALGATHDSARGAVRQQWQVSNPDLRMAGVSFSWRYAFAEAATVARSDLARLKLPLVITTPAAGSAAAAALCAPARTCEVRSMAGGKATHLEADAVRNAWLDLVDSAAARPIR